MCDTLNEKNLPDDKKPQYVYKRVQKVGEGKYISPVMGESMKLDVWKKAPKRPELKDQYEDLVSLLKRPYSKNIYTSSSTYVEHHDGMWGSFKHKADAECVDLINNFHKKDRTDRENKKRKSLKYSLPPIVVKCEVKGTVHSATFMGNSSYLCEYLKVVEEVGKPRYI